MKKSLFLLILPALLCAGPSASPFPQMGGGGEPKLLIQNMILTKVNGTTISLLDVMKKMDLYLYKAYPDLVGAQGAKAAKAQFYSSSWRHFLNEMINQELMLADAKEKELQVTDGEIREEIEKRFAPNIMLSLDNLELTYQEVWDMIKRELIVQRMSWYFIHSKALQVVTPQDIRQGYRDYLEKNPETKHWTYQMISVRGVEAEKRVAELYLLLKDREEIEVAAVVEQFQGKYPDVGLSVSNDYTNSSQTISKAHLDALQGLDKGDVSDPIVEISRADQKKVSRIFYVKDLSVVSPATFDQMANQLKNELIQKEVARESESYIERLKERYGYDNEALLLQVPKGFEPFQLR